MCNNVISMAEFKERKRKERLELWVEILSSSSCHRCGHDIVVIYDEQGAIMCKCENCDWMAFY